MPGTRRTQVMALGVLLAGLQAGAVETPNSTPIADDEDMQECLEKIIECLPWNQRDALEKLGAKNIRVAPPGDLKRKGGHDLGQTSSNYDCVTVSSELFTDPDKWRKKRVFFHEATHVGQESEGGGFCHKIKICYGNPINGRLDADGTALMATLDSYHEVDAGTQTLNWLCGAKPGAGAEDLESWKAAAKAEAEYLAENLEDLCDGIGKMPADEALDDMKAAFNKCARKGKAALEKYNEDADEADDVKVPENAAGK